jgi:hypothetical protein
VGYEAESWHDLFVASAGAAAALAGLVFVAISINIEQILKYDALPARALRTVLLLIGVVVASIFVLAPQSTTALGIELLVLGVEAAALSTYLLVRHRNAAASRGAQALQATVDLGGALPFAIAGLTLLLGSGGGLYWALAGVILATVGAMINAWVLMVEILR